MVGFDPVHLGKSKSLEPGDGSVIRKAVGEDTS